LKDGDYDKLAQTDEEIFKECAARLKLAEDAENENRKSGMDDRSFRYGNQWPDDISGARRLEGRPALTINHTDTFCRRIENNLRQQRPRIKAHPVDSGADINTAETVDGLIRHIETLSQASVAYDTAVASALDIGWGYARVLGEYIDEKSFDQELKVVAVRNTMTGYGDPASKLPDGSDWNWFLFVENISRTEYKRLYPDAANVDYQQTNQEYFEWDNKETIRLCEYYRVFEKAEKLYRMPDGSGCLESDLPSEEAQAQSGYTPIKDAKGKPVFRQSSRRVIQWFKINGKEIVDRRDEPSNCRYIPVARCEGNTMDLNGKVMRFGMVRNLRDPAQMYNFWRTSETERYALSPKAPWVAAEEQLDGHPEWDDANRKAYSVLKYKPVSVEGSILPPPQRQPPVPIEAGLGQAAMGAERDLMAVAGMPQEGQDGSRVVSGNKYLQRKQGINDLTHFQYFDNQTIMIRHIGRILLERIPAYYDTPRMQRIIGADGVPSMVGINQPQETDPGVMTIKNDLAVGRYDVVMDTGPGFQSKREESAETLLALLATPLGEQIVKTGSDIILRNLDVSGAQDLADRLMPTNPEGMDKLMEQLPKQAQSVVKALQSQLDEANKLIQQQHQEIKLREGIERGWMDVELKKAGISAQTKVHDTDTRAHTSLGVAEINTAGDLMNTNTEAAHDRAAAKELIDAGQKAARTN
jgi:hypothetical protein